MGSNISFDTATYDECIQAINEAMVEAASSDDKSSLHWRLSMEMGKVANNPNLTQSQINEIQAKLGALIGATS